MRIMAGRRCGRSPEPSSFTAPQLLLPGSVLEVICQRSAETIGAPPMTVLSCGVTGFLGNQEERSEWVVVESLEAKIRVGSERS